MQRLASISYWVFSLVALGGIIAGGWMMAAAYLSN